MFGGYKVVTPIQLANVLHARDTGAVDATAVRVYWAVLAAVAAREAASRVRRGRGGKGRQGDLCNLRARELARITGLSDRAVGRSLRVLSAGGLIVIRRGGIDVEIRPKEGVEILLDRLACGRSPRRPIPVPRALLRFLAREPRPGMARVMIAYWVRGLALERGTGAVKNRGTVKATWIAEIFGISLRAVRYAQAELRRIGWISKDTGSRQWKLNRDGAYFEIHVDWRPPITPGCDAEPSSCEGDEAGRKTCEQGIVNRDKEEPAVALPPVETSTPLAPPIEDSETSYESKDQETRSTDRIGSGVCGRRRRTRHEERTDLPPPDLQNIHPADLRSLNRLEALYDQAAQRGWIQVCDANALNFVAAAVRAREVADSPERLFVAIIRKRLWPHITQAQEDRARLALARLREEDPTRFRLRTGTSCAGRIPRP